MHITRVDGELYLASPSGPLPGSCLAQARAIAREGDAFYGRRFCETLGSINGRRVDIFETKSPFAKVPQFKYNKVKRQLAQAFYLSRRFAEVMTWFGPLACATLY